MKHVMIIVLLSGVSFLACDKREQQQRVPAVPVRLDAVSRHNITIPIHTSGSLSSQSDMRLAFKVAGIVDTITANEGESVQKGQRLATLQLEEIEAQVDKAESAYDKARRDFERVSKLYADSAVTLEQVQNAQTAMDIAHSDLTIARFNRRHATITAPAHGRVLKHLVKEHELVAAGQPVLYVSNLEGVWKMTTGVSDQDVVQLGLGDSARVVFDAYPNTVWSATISEIAGSVSPQTGTTEVTLSLHHAHPSFKTGFIARVTLYPSQRDSLFQIPISALVDADGPRGSVYTVETNRARKLDIEIAYISQDSVAVSTGLEQVKHIVTRGAAYLSDGTPVTVIERERTQP